MSNIEIKFPPNNSSFRKFNYKGPFKTSNASKKQIQNTAKTIDKYTLTGIYNLTTDFKFYIRQTAEVPKLDIMNTLGNPQHKS